MHAGIELLEQVFNIDSIGVIGSIIWRRRPEIEAFSSRRGTTLLCRELSVEAPIFLARGFTSIPASDGILVLPEIPSYLLGYDLVEKFLRDVLQRLSQSLSHLALHLAFQKVEQRLALLKLRNRGIGL